MNRSICEREVGNRKVGLEPLRNNLRAILAKKRQFFAKHFVDLVATQTRLKFLVGEVNYAAVVVFEPGKFHKDIISWHALT